MTPPRDAARESTRFVILTTDGNRWAYVTDDPVEEDDEAVILCNARSLPVRTEQQRGGEVDWRIAGSQIVAWKREEQDDGVPY